MLDQDVGGLCGVDGREMGGGLERMQSREAPNERCGRGLVDGLVVAETVGLDVVHDEEGLAEHLACRLEPPHFGHREAGRVQRLHQPDFGVARRAEHSAAFDAYQ